MTFLKRLFCKQNLFCKHEYNEVVCLHWTHGPYDNDIRFLEIQLKCKDCEKYHFTYIHNWDECYEFIAHHKDKYWSNTCKPVL